MFVEEKKKLLWKKTNPTEIRKSQMLIDFVSIGFNAREARDRSGLGSKRAKMQIGIEVSIRDPFPLTHKPLEEVTRKHLDKVISAQIVMDTYDGNEDKEIIVLFLEDGRVYRLSESDVLNKSLKKLQHMYYLLELKSEATRRWLNFLKKTIKEKARI